MAILDIIIIVILALAGLIGLLRGFLRTGVSLILNLLSLGVGAGLAYLCIPLGLVDFSIEGAMVKNIIILVVAFVIGLIIGLIVFGLLRKFILKARKNHGFKILDSVIGMIFSVTVWVLIMWCACGVASTLEDTPRDPTDQISETAVTGFLYFNNPAFIRENVATGCESLYDSIGYDLNDILDMVLPSKDAGEK